MDNKKPVILVAFKEGGENGGPFISHKRIVEGYHSDHYELKPFFFPRSRVLFSPKGLSRLVHDIKKEKPVAMLIVGLQIEGFVATIACKLAKVGIILAVHGSAVETCGINPLNRFFMSIIEKYTVMSAEIVYGVSDYVSGWNICKKAKHMYGTIYNLPENFDYDVNVQSTIRNELGLQNDDIVIVSTGRIIVDKGYDVLLKVMEYFREKETIKFVIAGDGYYKATIEEKVQQLQMEKQVFMLGYRADIDNILSGSDLFVICTKHETLCISLQEAGAHCLPLVATNVGGIPEIIDSSCGFLVENEDVKGFVKAISRLVEDPILRKTMGTNARKKIVTKFDSKVIFDKLDEVFTEMINIGCENK